MRWLALALLVVNMLYLSWEYGRDVKSVNALNRAVIDIPADAARLDRIDELAELPPSREIPAQFVPLREMPARR